ncbi:MAG TPA: DUF1223 domain-containing protein, partial [Polyangiaceae bacterium]|nr:DUF1223 domain-containing protein [Polyangiaceae bacterium]
MIRLPAGPAFAAATLAAAAAALALLAPACSPGPAGPTAALASSSPTALAPAPAVALAPAPSAAVAPAPTSPTAALGAPHGPTSPKGVPLPLDAKPAPPGAFALVELFTSEGCSSCPPADEALDELAVDAERRGLPVYALSFHVDYWNSLGWVDPFSTSAYTHRQEAYAGRAGSRGLYTPQMFVNGGEGFIGSDRGRARRDVDRALGAAPPAAPRLGLRVDLARPSVRVELGAPEVPAG